MHRIDILKEWCEHAIIPFQGIEREEKIEKMISMSLNTSVEYSAGVFDFSGNIVGFRWDKENRISVFLNGSVEPDMFKMEF